MERDQSGGFTAQIDSKKGGKPAGAKWTLAGSQNATAGPARALANPASFSYKVTNAGPGVEVQVTLRATSRAGVAERTWTQPTKEPPPPPPPPAEIFGGTFSGTANYSPSSLDITAQWSGAAKWKQDPPIQLPAQQVAFYSYKLISGSMTYSFTGSSNDCHVAGSGPIDMGAQFDLTTASSLILWDDGQHSYQMVLPAPMFASVDGETSECKDAEDNGEDFDWIPAAGIPALVYAPEKLGAGRRLDLLRLRRG